MSENTENQQDGRIIQINIEEQMKTAYIDYSMSVIVGRALPDVRDGLKPVHRRVLFGMNELGNNSNKPYKKSARIVGEVMGKFHPHGDASIYDTIVRMAQPWSLRYMLVDGQGNFGSVDGDMPAAMRYTEIRLQRMAEAMLEDIDKETVDFTLNFDDTLEEPTVLPTRIPNLLINGASGIAVGMATNIMPHNLSEVVDGLIAYIDNRDITIEELIKHVKAPDFPTGGIIYGYEGVKQGFETGRGRVVVRGKVNVETSKAGRERLVIYELPYQINKAALHQKIAQLADDKIIEGISEARDESDRDGMRLVIDLKREAIANVVINQLYKYSELQTSYGINNVALVKGRPRVLNLKDMLSEFVDFRHEVVVRRTRFDLRKAEEKAHILQGYLIALDHLDEVIALIRASRTPEEAKEGLMTRFELSEIQSKAILELRLQRLTGMERDKIKEEYDEVMKLIAYLKEILSDEGLRFKIIKDELEDVKKRFGDERKTEIQYLASEMRMEDIIAEEDVVITISHLGYIKRTSAYDYRQQKRGGRGALGGKTREEDYIEHLFVASTHHTMLFFTEKGRCYWLKVYEIPEGEKSGKGRAIQNLINLPTDDKIRAIIDIKDLGDKEFISSHYIVLCTANGIIKKTLLEDFSRPRQNGVNAITINEGDQLLEAKLTNGNSQIMMAIKSGRAIRFPENTVRDTGRGAIGVRGIEVDNDKDEVVGMICVNKEDETRTVLVVSEKGFGKRTDIEEYRITNRGGKGVKTINITEKTGSLIAILDVTEKDDLMITCKSGITIRMAVADIREAGRATQGVRLIRLDDSDEIAAVARLDEQEEQRLDEEALEGMEGNESNQDGSSATQGDAPVDETPAE
ncbi:DNA gyrase subunit A [Chitinophaga pinensis]|uniref:DNA gyrase subunit A n=1 Tax=Chitinophaga pinensis (strain ATCC 43595 / DSM 2588 / LMG 13176 / NBRC 15968 / NCIMB 11800 / UQM 2034) TaxID=485918 RepID=A0A979G8T1_CHIPD|nr:DNA gyrase subunit A [Chitinophaga pinensis]ACU62875.1 DNA gyrase, A subunit [Chitinophaga pinensis DSM 2588]